MKEQELREKFYKRLEKEFEDFKEELKKQTPDKIINKAYELVVKEEIVSSFYPESDKFDISDIKSLNKLHDNIVGTLYDDWIDSDYNFHNDIEDCISDSIIDLKEYQEMQKKSKDKER